jgi:hypothetical protein
MAKKATSSKAGTPKRESWKLQGYQPVTLKRSTLNFHEQNPRFIDSHAFRKLRDSLKRNRLVEPVVVNRRLAANGFPEEQDGMLVIVGGHQRTKAADSLMSYPEKAEDYEVPGALIEVPPGREKEILVSLNNPGLQGQWDASILEDLLGSEGIDIANTGFERADLAHILDDGMLDGLFGEAGTAQAKMDAPIVDQLNDIHATARQFEKDVKAAAAADPEASPSPAGPAEAPEGPPEPRTEKNDPELMREGMIQRRREYVERQAANNATQFLLVFVAETEEQLGRFLYDAGLPDENYMSLGVLAEKLGVPLIGVGDHDPITEAPGDSAPEPGPENDPFA